MRQTLLSVCYLCRRSTLKSATNALYQLVRVFPMTRFHQGSQRFAVGNTDGSVVIFDLRTAAKWRIFEGHTGTVFFAPKDIFLHSASECGFIHRRWVSIGFLSLKGSKFLFVAGMCVRHAKNSSTFFFCCAVFLLWVSWRIAGRLRKMPEASAFAAHGQDLAAIRATCFCQACS